MFRCVSPEDFRDFLSSFAVATASDPIHASEEGWTIEDVARQAQYRSPVDRYLGRRRRGNDKDFGIMAPQHRRPVNDRPLVLRSMPLC